MTCFPNSLHDGNTLVHRRCVAVQAAQERSWQMNTHDISQTMRGLANLRLGSRLLVQALVHRAATILDTFNTQVRTCKDSVECLWQAAG